MLRYDNLSIDHIFRSHCGSKTTLSIPSPATNQSGVYVTYEDVYGKKPTVEEMKYLLSELSFNTVLVFVTLLNNMLCLDAHTMMQMRMQQINFVRDVCSPELYIKLIRSSFNRIDGMVFFLPQQLRFVLRHAFVSCPTTGGQDLIKGKHIFAEVCLIANSLIANDDKPLVDKSEISVASHILPLLEISADTELISTLGRAREIWTDIISASELEVKKHFKEFNECFSSAYGLKIETFLAVLYAVYACTLRKFDSKEKPWAPYIVCSGNLVNKEWNKNTIDAALGIVAGSIELIRNEIAKQPTNYSIFDFSVFQRFPLIKVLEDTYIIYDVEYLIRFFFYGVWRSILSTLDTQKQEAFRSFFGDLFSRYVRRILTHICSDAGSSIHRVLHPSMKFRNTNHEVCDELLVEDNKWLVIEVKGSFLRNKTKYSGDPEDLRVELEQKFAKGATDTSESESKSKPKKGVYQLASNIRRLIDNEKTTVREVDIRRCACIYPIIICSDIAMSNIFISLYLNAIFLKALGELPENSPLIMPLTVLTVVDTEAISAISSRQPISDLIDAYHYKSDMLHNFRDNIFRIFNGDIELQKSYSYPSYESLHKSLSEIL